ncbi:MAG TPA: hypothetical protein VE954_10055 [Oligoflexus sp.]|uniref:hypothetical protein n=1 Tax=Oligoflexus sp. TaxID=1971216 RepID=UPI002D461ED3|nr:hypothetical protein [Oligoflexus sp.]HYX33445.1 hypothetical protein [Oligoflexus sp.]
MTNPSKNTEIIHAENLFYMNSIIPEDLEFEFAYEDHQQGTITYERVLVVPMSRNSRLTILKYLVNAADDETLMRIRQRAIGTDA